MMNARPECHDTRLCFAKVNGRCTILSETYPDNLCKFRKLERGSSDRDIEIYMERMEARDEEVHVFDGVHSRADAYRMRGFV